MRKSKVVNCNKKDISKNISLNTGLSKNYTKIIVEDFISILKILILRNTANLKNFGSFKTIYKNKRTGRNPKTNEIYEIRSRKTISFTPSKKLKNIINNTK